MKNIIIYFVCVCVCVLCILKGDNFLLRLNLVENKVCLFGRKEIEKKKKK